MNKEDIFIFMYLFLYLGVPAMLVWMTYCERFQKFDLSALWVHRGRVDKLAVIVVGSWWVHTCSMILMMLSSTAASADYGLYMGWAIPIIAKMFAPQQAAPEEPAKPGAAP